MQAAVALLGAALFVAYGQGSAADLGPRMQAEWREPLTGMAFRLVRPGRLQMGSPLFEIGREAQERIHEVSLTRPFYLGVFEVTQAEWQAIEGTNPSHFRGEPRLPVEQITWDDAQRFVAKLTSLSADSRFRLPTEAEWEYACRASTTSAYPTGSVLTTRDANFDARVTGPRGVEPAFRGATTPVGSFPANPWGFHDLSGNVWEWTDDEHCEYPDGPVSDPVGRCGGALKVIRGGSWYFGADSARCALRYTHRPGDRGFSLGLRLVREEK